MRVGVLTFHHVDNFGAAWQCYGLCSTLRQLGHEPFLVNYRPAGSLPVYRMPTGRLGLSMRMIAYFKKRTAFDRFRKHQLPPQSALHTSLGSLEASPPTADAFIAGSDQIWNPSLFGGVYDPAYFLGFARGARRIAYAASFGESRPLELNDALRDMLSEMDCIGVREQKAAARLAEEFGVEVHVTCDPALLPQDFTNFRGRYKIPGRFAFCYNLFNRATTDQLCRALAEERGCDVRRVNDDWKFWRYDVHREFGIGPVRWLNLIDQADFVMSDSFHATVFSVILEKKFVSVLANKEKGGTNRIVSLLEALGLTTRIISEGDSVADVRRRLEEPVDWSEVRARLAKLRESSLHFLQEALAPASEATGKVPGPRQEA